MNNARNSVGWFEIYVQDMERAKAFYEKTFAVKLEPLPSPIVKMVAFPMQPDKPGSPGALVKMEGFESGGNSTIIYFSSEDCAIESARAAKSGGKVFKEKFSIGEYGFISLVNDTEGNLIGLHSLK
jgi:predicted enzyme related to lactoylglutathione lyase